MSELQNTFSYQWFQNVWNESREEYIDQMVDGSAIITGLQEELTGPSGFKVFYYGFRNGFDKIFVTVTSVISHDDGEEAFCHVTAVHKASGRPVDFTGKCRLKLSGNKIIEATNDFDFATMNEQISAVEDVLQ
ncbi:MAG TPA: ester cyclase [Flavisolibacter sp.]